MGNEMTGEVDSGHTKNWNRFPYVENTLARKQQLIISADHELDLICGSNGELEFKLFRLFGDGSTLSFLI